MGQWEPFPGSDQVLIDAGVLWSASSAPWQATLPVCPRFWSSDQTAKISILWEGDHGGSTTNTCWNDGAEVQRSTAENQQVGLNLFLIIQLPVCKQGPL